MKNRGGVTKEEIRQVSSTTVQEIYDKLLIAPLIPSLSEQDITDIATRFNEKYSLVKKEVFEKIPVIEATALQLKTLSPLFFTKSVGTLDPLWLDFSGIVIAEFGEKDIFPSLVAYRIEEMFLPKKHDRKRRTRPCENQKGLESTSREHSSGA
jgi:hypothetical protein